MAKRGYESHVARAPASASARELAEQMRAQSMGSLVIVDDAERPVGIVTDRDLLVRVVATEADPDVILAEAVMSKPLATATSDEPIDSLVERMARAGVRRLPILHDGELSGIVALDDLLVWLARELGDLADATRSEIETGWMRARRERKAADLEQRLRELRESLRSAGSDAVAYATKELEALRNRLTGRDKKDDA